MIYVDTLQPCPKSARWRWPTACHLFTDPTTDLGELHKFARRIGLQRAWFQNRPDLPHYDLNPSRRQAAVSAGAVELNREQTVARLRAWRAARAAREAQRA